jgi:hypothetical protein
MIFDTQDLRELRKAVRRALDAEPEWTQRAVSLVDLLARLNKAIGDQDATDE